MLGVLAVYLATACTPPVNDAVVNPEPPPAINVPIEPEPVLSVTPPVPIAEPEAPIMETSTVVLPPTVEPELPAEPERPDFNVTPQVFTVGFDGDGFPIKGVSDSLDNLFEDSYTELRDLRIESVDNDKAVISDDGLRFSYISTNDETQTVVMLTLSSVEDDRVSVSAPYTLNFVDKSTADLINETIFYDLDIPENHKRLIRSLPDELNVFHRDGVSEYNIAKIEAVSDVFDRVERVTDVFMYEDYPTDFIDVLRRDVVIPIRTFSQDRIDSVARHAFALASVIDFNKDTVEYHDDDFQRVAEALSDVSNATLNGRDYEPFYGLSVENATWCQDNNIEGKRRFDSFVICIDGVTYGIDGGKGLDYHEFVSTDQDFYLRNKGEDIAIQAIQDRFGNPIKSLNELTDEQFSYFHDNALLIGVREIHIVSGSLLYYGNLRIKSNVENLDVNTNFNVYNLSKLYVGDASTPQEATERFLDNRADVLSHFSSLPQLFHNIGFPTHKPEEADQLKDLYEKYDNVTSFSWIPSVFYLLPEELDGIIESGSTNMSGVLAAVLKNLNIPSIQLSPTYIFGTDDPDLITGNYTEIFADFDDPLSIGVPERIFVEGNITFGEKIPNFCSTFIPYRKFEDALRSWNLSNQTYYCSDN